MKYEVHTEIKHGSEDSNGKVESEVLSPGDTITESKAKSLGLDVDALVAAGAIAPEGEPPAVAETRIQANKRLHPNAPYSGQSAPGEPGTEEGEPEDVSTEEGEPEDVSTGE